MRPCRYRPSWQLATGNVYRCHNRFTIFGLCIEHRLERWRWEWGRGRFYVTLDLGCINRPYVQVSDERPIEWAALSYGTDGCDPVWSIGWNTRPPSDDEEVG